MITNPMRALFVGAWGACSVGANFTPHIITVNAGEVIELNIVFYFHLMYFYLKTKQIYGDSNILLFLY